jgi:large subunit ribosomal protein L25
MQIGETIALSALSAPEGVTLLDDPEAVLATLSPPRLQTEEEEIETETELVGEGEGEAAEQGEAAEGEGSEGSSGGE